MNTVWLFAITLVALTLTLKVFRGIVTGKLDVLFLHFARDNGERAFSIWMAVWAFACLLLFFVALRIYLGPMGF